MRKLTPRECARLQGYQDDWFVILTNVSRNQIYKQIGNSITVPLVTKIAESVMQVLTTINPYMILLANVDERGSKGKEYTRAAKMTGKWRKEKCQ
ncbi:MAG: DNA cytosine methyltransferase [Chloroflexi bacterium]|nr:DNA cytosine methyltransferase [Chloroflexota bacterium]